MIRTVILLLSVCMVMLAPALGCSRNNDAATPLKATVDTIAPPVLISSGRTHTYLALGDSYTVGTSIATAGSYPFQTQAILDQSGLRFSDPLVVAANGWTTTDLLAALNDSSHSGATGTYDMVTLLIGVNNQYQGGTVDNYRKEFTALLTRCISYAGNKADHVVVISIPDYSVSVFGQRQHRPGVAEDIDAFNKANKAITAGKGAKYLNVTDYTRAIGSNTSLYASDGLHYSSGEYQLWAADLAKIFLATVEN